MKTALILLMMAATALCFAQTQPQDKPPAEAKPGTEEDISGMYTFLSDGEFLQIDVEDGTRVTGFISRYGEEDSDKGAFLDHLIKEGELKGDQLHFVTKTVHGVWYEFNGTVVTDSKKVKGEEGYRTLKGKLTVTSETKKSTTKSREVELKSMPMEDMVIRR
ncbi:MAG TPA: hypothetical protein VN577_16155 [Terriglobales bacterium]|nr:hypothetical protein [Terriglobales bacterium]